MKRKKRRQKRRKAATRKRTPEPKRHFHFEIPRGHHVTGFFKWFPDETTK